MKKSDPILTPELVKVLKIFMFSAVAIVLVFSFFNDYRADNTGKDRSFRIADSDRIYFQNVRSINYDREFRQDAGMTLFRHRNRLQSSSLPTLDLVILLNPTKDEAYIYFELTNAEWPATIKVDGLVNEDSFEFANGNNRDHLELFQRLAPTLAEDAKFELLVGDTAFPIWTSEKEKEAVKTVIEDYLRLLALTN